MLYPLNYGVGWQNLSFYPDKLSNLQPIPPLSFFHVEFDQQDFVNSIFVYECPQLILSLEWYVVIFCKSLLLSTLLILLLLLHSPVEIGPSNATPG